MYTCDLSPIPQIKNYQDRIAITSLRHKHIAHSTSPNTTNKLLIQLQNQEIVQTFGMWMSVLEEERVHSVLECCQESVSKGILHCHSKCQASDLMAQIAVCLGKMMARDNCTQTSIYEDLQKHTLWIISGTFHLHHIKK